QSPMRSLDVQTSFSSVNVVGEVVIVDPVLRSGEIPEERRGVPFDDYCVLVGHGETLVIDPYFSAGIALSDEFFVDGTGTVSVLLSLTGLETDCTLIEGRHAHRHVES